MAVGPSVRAGSILPSHDLYRAIDRDGELLDSMLSEHRDKHAARRFLRRLVEVAERKPLRVTTDKHPAYRGAIRWILGRKVLHRTTQYLNNYTEQSHRAVKQRYYPMLGFGGFEAARRFCAAFDELRQYFRVHRRGEAHVTLAEQRRLFLTRWRSLIAELAAAYGGVGCHGNSVAESIGDLRSDRAHVKCACGGEELPVRMFLGAVPDPTRIPGLLAQARRFETERLHPSRTSEVRVAP